MSELVEATLYAVGVAVLLLLFVIAIGRRK